MIVRIFKTNQVYIFAFIPLVLVILGLGAFDKAFSIGPRGQLPFVYHWFDVILSRPLLSFLVSIGLIAIQAYQLAKICEENRLMSFSTNFPAFILALNYLILAWQQIFSPAVVAGVFMVMAMRRIFLIYNQKHMDGNLFRAGIYVSVASLFYLPCLLLMPVFLYQLWLFRPFAWREWVIPFTGLITPYIYAFTYYLLTDELNAFLSALITAAIFYAHTGKSLTELLPVIFSVAMLAAGLIYLPMTDHRRTVRINNLYKVMFVFIILTGLAAVIQRDDKTSFLIMLIPPMSIVQSYFILGVQRNWLKELLVYIPVLLIIIRAMLTE